MSISGFATPPPRLMDSSDLAQAAAVQNTWYTVLDTTTFVYLYGLFIQIETAGETLEMRATIDGVVWTGSLACLADTAYYVYFDPRGNNVLVFSSTVLNPGLYSPMPGRSVKIEVRKTTAAGANTLYSRVSYGRGG